MTQPPPNIIYVPCYVPVTWIQLEWPSAPPEPVKPEEEEEYPLADFDDEDELEKTIKVAEDQIKLEYRKKLFKTVLQGEIYTQPSKEKK